MKNLLVTGIAQRDIDKQVTRILKDLGTPAPPLDLRVVRDLLRLDLGFYSTEDPNFLQTTIHRMKVAGKQIIERPSILLDVIRKASLSALWLPDRKRILIDDSKPPLKHRWLETHEIGHSIIPWHEDVLHGDDGLTLSPACRAEVEAEANYAAGQLLFMQRKFVDVAFSSAINMANVRALKDTFGNTLTTTLWRYVESVPGDVPVVGVIGSPPREMRLDRDPETRLKYCIQSPAFAKRFSRVSGHDLLDGILSYCQNRRGGPLGQAEVVLEDDAGDRHAFLFESFFNRYEVLTLGAYLRSIPVMI